MPTPPALAKDLEYCSVSIERHTPVPGVSPNGPSPLRPEVICENIELRNIASKSVAVVCALACACGETFFRAAANPKPGRPLMIGIVKLDELVRPELIGLPSVLLIWFMAITSPRYRLRWRPRP